MSLFHFKLDNPELANIKQLIDRDTLALQKNEATLQRIEQTEKTIQNTKSVLYEKKRSYTGDIPLSPYLDICEILQLDPCKLFPANLIESEVMNWSAEDDIQKIRTELEQQANQIQIHIHHLQELLRCAGSKPGTLEHEIFIVLKKYADLEIEITIDQAVGIALANRYRVTGDIADIERFATRGTFALREVGNCAADVVFDPILREQMSKKYKQLGKWSRHTVMKEYLRISESGTDNSTIKAYQIEYDKLKDLPEHILYGLVVCGEGHALRILKVMKNGIHAVEGNINGKLSFGRFIPFCEITWGEKNLIVYSRQPASQYGLEQEFSPYNFTNPDEVGYESIKESLDDLNQFGYFKLTSERQYIRLPLPVRDSINVLRFRPGKMYDITHFRDFIQNESELFPNRSKADVIAAFLKTACNNPTGSIVVVTIATDKVNNPQLPKLRRKVPAEAAKQMYAFYDKEGGEKVSLYQMSEIFEGMRHEYGDKVPRISLFKLEEFEAMDEDTKATLAILTPRRDDRGNHEEAESYLEYQLMRTYQESPALLLDDESKSVVSLEELMQNPLDALILMERPIDMLGIANRLIAGELKILEKYPIKETIEHTEKIIARKMEIRQQNKNKLKTGLTKEHLPT